MSEEKLETAQQEERAMHAQDKQVNVIVGVVGLTNFFHKICEVMYVITSLHLL